MCNSHAFLAMVLTEQQFMHQVIVHYVYFKSVSVKRYEVPWRAGGCILEEHVTSYFFKAYVSIVLATVNPS